MVVRLNSYGDLVLLSRSDLVYSMLKSAFVFISFSANMF